MKNDQQKLQIELKNHPRERCTPTHTGVGGPPTRTLVGTHTGVAGTAHAGVAILNLPFPGVIGVSRTDRVKQELAQAANWRQPNFAPSLKRLQITTPRSQQDSGMGFSYISTTPLKRTNGSIEKMTTNKLNKRIEKLEETIHPQPQRKWAKIIQEVGESKEDAISKAGITPEEREDYNFWFIQIVDPPARDPISGEILN